MKRPRFFEALTTALLAVLIGAVLAAPAMAQGNSGKNKDKDGGGGDDGGTTEPAAVSYSITLLETLGGDQSFAYGINFHGDVVGRSCPQVGRERAYLSTIDPDLGRVIIDLNTLLSAADQEKWFLQMALDINDDGQIVGIGQILSDSTWLTFRMTPGIYDDDGNYHYPFVEDLGPGVNPAGINAHGKVTGYLNYNEGPRAVLVDEFGVRLDLGVLRSNDNDSRGEAINAFDHIAGYSGENGVEFRAFLYTPETGMTNLGVIKSGRGGYSQSFAYDINDDSVVVGRSTAGGWKEHAFRWQNGVMEDLGSLGGNTSEGRGVNIFGDVVGRSTTSDGTWRTFICPAGSKMADLQNLVVKLPAGFNLYGSPHMRINALGEITGTGVDADGTWQAYLLTPLQSAQQ